MLNKKVLGIYVASAYLALKATIRVMHTYAQRNVKVFFMNVSMFKYLFNVSACRNFMIQCWMICLLR